jgi:8-oxo-dGTP diphosphatase
LISRDSKLLVCQRRRSDSHGLRWEFPGGKVEAGESPTEALARELREELGVAATIGGEVYRTRYRYKDLQEDLVLIFYWAKIGDSASMQNLAFERFEWAGPAVLPQYDFLPADKELIDLLASGSIRVH